MSTLRSLRASLLHVGLLTALGACGAPAADPDGGTTPDAGFDAAETVVDAGVDANVDASDEPDAAHVDAGSDAWVSCLGGHAEGDRYEVGDRCNFCSCLADGTEDCTDRSCLVPAFDGCEYDGTVHAYGERFPSTDACNECTCAASGLACTRRSACPPSDEGAILLDSLGQPCGDDPTFTTQAVLAGLPHDGDVTLPFLYNRTGVSYPESLPDTEVRLRIVRDQSGYMACRIPSPGQEAIDLEVLVEWYTLDGAFDETFHAYLRRNRGGFTNEWNIVASLRPGVLNGSYSTSCLDFRGLSFSATFDADGSVGGAVHKTCETDISLVVGSFERPAD